MKASPELGLAVLRAFLRERSPLGPLQVMAERIGRFFQIPLPGFRPYVVFGPEANRKVLITEREKLLWRNTDPVTDLLRRGVLIVDGDEHDKYRALMEPPLHPAQLPDYTQMMIRQTERVTSTWKAGEAVDMLVEGRKIALLIIMETLFSKDVWDDLSRRLGSEDHVRAEAWQGNLEEAPDPLGHHLQRAQRRPLAQEGAQHGQAQFGGGFHAWRRSFDAL